jgi:hypothetical protein
MSERSTDRKPARNVTEADLKLDTFARIQGSLQSVEANMLILQTQRNELLDALNFISDGLHKAANGGFTGAGEHWTVGKLKDLIRNYVQVAERAIARVEGKQ